MSENYEKLKQLVAEVSDNVAKAFMKTHVYGDNDPHRYFGILLSTFRNTPSAPAANPNVPSIE